MPALRRVYLLNTPRLRDPPGTDKLGTDILISTILRHRSPIGPLPRPSHYDSSHLRRVENNPRMQAQMNTSGTFVFKTGNPARFLVRLIIYF